MTRASNMRIERVRLTTQRIAYRTPMKFGGRVVNEALLCHVEVDASTLDGRRASGKGSMPLGNAWAWPSATVSGDQSLAAMLRLAQSTAQQAERMEVVGHPLEIGASLLSSLAPLADQAATGLPEEMPGLARLVAASPVDAAIHDAYGKALGANSYRLLGPEFVNRDLSAYLGDAFRGEYLDRYTLPDPRPSMPIYHLVGALDPLGPADVARSVGDGLPESLDQWIAADGLTHLKIKLAGDDLAWDVQRVVDVERVAEPAQHQRGCFQWSYSLDFNEKCANVEYVLDFLGRLAEESPRAWDRVQYIEQPTHRDLRAHPENRMHAAARIKPVVIDESLLDYESLLLARQQGYSGVALKACKGHTEALLMGAAAQKHGLFLCVQDLTCVGASFLHSASLAARFPGVAAIEGNGRQYCPAGNAGWSERFPGMFLVRNGQVATAELTGAGLY